MMCFAPEWKEKGYGPCRVLCDVCNVWVKHLFPSLKSTLDERRVDRFWGSLGSPPSGPWTGVGATPWRRGLRSSPTVGPRTLHGPGSRRAGGSGRRVYWNTNRDTGSLRFLFDGVTEFLPERGWRMLFRTVWRGSVGWRTRLTRTIRSTVYPLRVWGVTRPNKTVEINTLGSVERHTRTRKTHGILCKGFPSLIQFQRIPYLRCIFPSTS